MEKDERREKTAKSEGRRRCLVIPDPFDGDTTNSGISKDIEGGRSEVEVGRTLASCAAVSDLDGNRLALVYKSTENY